MREMKDSGIEWIGEIPTDWETRKIKQLADPNVENSFVDGDWIESPHIVDSGIRYLTTGNIGDGVFKEQGNGYITPKTFEELACKYAFPGDLIISRLNTPYGRSCILPSNYAEYVVAVDNVILRTQEDKRYICYVSQCDGYKQTVADEAKGTTMKRISRTNLGNIVIPLPPVHQQHRIADYLDRKCSQIDAIIARQQEVIEKLKAYKLSVITEAVTKGLNPDVPMKGSGVEWIGKIPEHWETASISRVATVVRGASPRPAGDPRYFNGQDVPWITVAEVTKDDGKYITSTESYLTEEGAKCSRIVEKGTLLLSNSGATLGVPKVTLITGCINDGSVAFFDLKVTQMYLFYVFKSRTLELRKQMQGYGQPNLNTTIIKSITIPLPHSDEQKSICEYLDKRCKAVDDAIEIKGKVVGRLSDYKKSLIYEVVTGKKEV